MPIGRDGDEALFVKDGAPVKFCFHRSVTQGRGRITRDVERHGGQVVADERIANVLLVDEQEDIGLLRRQYYNSTERYRLCIFVELRGFVQACIRSGAYHHEAPARQGMPGRAPGRGARPRVAYTEEDRDHLAFYLATRCPTRDGRMGNSAYKDLEQLGQTEDAVWAWARRHTWHSWREHYKMRAQMMNPRIDRYVQRLKNIGHHFGHDPRSHDYRNLQRRVAEEEEEEDWEGIEQREGQRHPAPAPRRQERAARHYLARHERELLIIEDSDEEEEEVVAPEPPPAKPHRDLPNARRRDAPEVQAKKARVSADERRASGSGAGRGKNLPAPEEDPETQGSEEIEGDDLFGDRAYEDELQFEDQDADFPVPFSPRASPGPPPSTQATLIASPHRGEKEPMPVPVVESRANTPPPPTFPPSSQVTLVVNEEHVVQRIPVRGASAEPGPSVPSGKRTRGEAVDAPYRNTRARSRSVEPQSQFDKQGDKEDKGKGVEEERGETVGVSANGGASGLDDEMTVEGLLETSIDDIEDEDEEDSDDELPRYQTETDESEPSDSDDKETHGSLVKGIESEDEDDAEEIERMGNMKLVAAPPEPRVTRSKTASQMISPRRTRSGTLRSTPARKRRWIP